MNINMNSIGYNNIYSLYSNAASLNNNGLDMKKLNSLISNMGKNNAAASKDAKEYLTGIKQNANDLKSLTKSLTASNGVFSQKDVKSSNEDAVSTKTTAAFNPYSKGYEVSVKQVAAKQQNVSSFAKPEETTSLSAGKNSFAIEMGGKSTLLSIDVKETDTNKDVQQKMAAAINSSGLGLEAKVVDNGGQDDEKETALSIESKNTGAKNSFVIKNADDGNLVSKMGADQVKETAKDAAYKINNGELKTSASNDVEIAKGLTATFKKTADNVKLTPEQNKEAVIGAVQGLVDSYNKLMDIAAGSSADRGAQSIVKQLSGTVKTYQSSLAKIGVTVNSADGKLVVDDKTLDKAVESKTVEKALGASSNGMNYGFTSKLSKIASDIDRNPAAYVTKTSASSTAAKTNFWNSKASGLGLLFDALM